MKQTTTSRVWASPSSCAFVACWSVALLLTASCVAGQSTSASSVVGQSASAASSSGNSIVPPSSSSAPSVSSLSTAGGSTSDSSERTDTKTLTLEAAVNSGGSSSSSGPRTPTKTRTLELDVTPEPTPEPTMQPPPPPPVVNATPAPTLSGDELLYGSSFYAVCILDIDSYSFDVDTFSSQIIAPALSAEWKPLANKFYLVEYCGISLASVASDTWHLTQCKGLGTVNTASTLVRFTMEKASSIQPFSEPAFDKTKLPLTADNLFKVLQRVDVTVAPTTMYDDAIDRASSPLGMLIIIAILILIVVLVAYVWSKCMKRGAPEGAEDDTQRRNRVREAAYQQAAAGEGSNSDSTASPSMSQPSPAPRNANSANNTGGDDAIEMREHTPGSAPTPSAAIASASVRSVPHTQHSAEQRQQHPTTATQPPPPGAASTPAAAATVVTATPSTGTTVGGGSGVIPPPRPVAHAPASLHDRPPPGPTGASANSRSGGKHGEDIDMVDY